MWIKETYQCSICESAFISLYKVPGKCTETAMRGNLISVRIIWNWADKQSSCSLLGIIRIWLCAQAVILPVELRLWFWLLSVTKWKNRSLWNKVMAHGCALEFVAVVRPFRVTGFSSFITSLHVLVVSWLNHAVAHRIGESFYFTYFLNGNPKKNSRSIW